MFDDKVRLSSMMSTPSQTETKRLYSWWWASHVSPKNSKWLQDDLTDMDIRVKSMIKLIEEDADSFAKRAEMYYKKRPELMKLVEEFYRAYRALAERYDHATRALRQAHRTMTETFPDQVSFAVFDDLPSPSSPAESEPCTPEMPSAIHTLFGSDDLQKETNFLPHFTTSKRSGAYAEEFDIVASKKGLKQVHEMFTSPDMAVNSKCSESKVRKGLQFREEMSREQESKLHVEHDSSGKHENKEVAFEKEKMLLDEIAQLSIEIENLKKQLKSETENASYCKVEAERLQEINLKLVSDKEDIASCYHQSLKKISDLESEVDNFRYLNLEMSSMDNKLNGYVEKNTLLQNENQFLQSELEKLRRDIGEFSKALSMKQEEFQKLEFSMCEKHSCLMQAEAAVESWKQLHGQSQEELGLYKLEKETIVEKLKHIELEKQSLEEEIYLDKKALKRSHMELEELQSAIEDTQMQALQVEVDLQTFKDLYGQSVNQLRIASREMQCALQTLQSTEFKKQALEVDVLHVKAENAKLSRELNEIRGEMEDLKLSLKVEHSRTLLVEETLESLKESYSNSQKELELLSLDKVNGAELLRMTEIRKQMLEDENSVVKEENKHLSIEILQKQKELEKLKIILQDEHSRSIQAEASYASVKEMHAQVQEELMSIQSEWQKEVQMRKTAELQRQSSEEQIQHLREEIFGKDHDLELKIKEINKLKTFLDDTQFQSMQTLTALESLKKLHTESQEELRILLDKRENDATNLKNIEIQKSALQEKIKELSQNNDIQYLEIEKTREELNVLKLFVIDGQLKFEQCEATVESLKKLYSESQEELKLALEERENKVETLNNLEMHKQNLEKEIQLMKEENDYFCSELKQKQEEVEKLELLLHDEHTQAQKAEAALESLKQLFAKSQEELKQLLEEKQNEGRSLETIKLQKLSLEEEIGQLKEQNAKQNQEFGQKQEELNKLKLCLEAKELQSVQTEAAIESLKKLYTDSREEVRLVSEKRLNDGQMLKNIELQKQIVEEEMRLISEENSRLNIYVMRKEEELDKLRFFLEQEQLCFVQSEVTLELLNMLYIEVQKESKHSFEERQTVDKMLKDMELKKEAMEDNLHLVERENAILNVELVQMREELMQLNKFIEDERMCVMHAETSLAHIRQLHAITQDALYISSLDMQIETRILEEKNQSTSVNLHQVVEENQTLKNKLNQNERKMEDLEVSIKSQQLQFSEVAGAFNSLEQLYADTQEQLKHISAERQNDIQILTSLELTNRIQEEENQKLISEHNEKLQQIELLHILLNEQKLQSEQVEVALESLKKSYTQSREELNILYIQMENNAQILKDIEVQKDALEKEIMLAREENENLNETLHDKQEEITRLCNSLLVEQCRCTQGVAALKSLEGLYSQAQNELKNLILSVQQKDQILEELELKNQYSEEEVVRMEKEMANIRKRNTVSLSIIKNLQGETFLLKEKNIKLANDLQLYTKSEKAFQLEISHLKEQLNNLEAAYKCITDQMKAVGLDSKSLQSSVKNLHDENLMLKANCTKHENEKVLLLEKLAEMQKLSERNVILANSLNDAEFELERLREKLQTFEKSCSFLQDSNSVLISENSSLITQVCSITENTEEILEKNVFFENSLHVAGLELEETKGKLRCFEEICHSICDEKSNLQRENRDLLSKVESFDNSLKILEEKYAELHEKCSNLEDEKDLAQRTVCKLQTFLSKEKMDKENILQSSNDKLVHLDHQIGLLHEEIRHKDKVILEKENNLLALLIEIFIFQSCLHDMHDINLIISEDFCKLEQEVQKQKKIMGFFLEQTEKLTNGVISIWTSVDSNLNCVLDVDCELFCQLIFDKLRRLHDYHCELEDEKHLQSIENMVIWTLLHQVGLDMVELKLEKSSLHQHCRIIDNELLLIHKEKHDILEMNGQIRHELEEVYHREEILKAEMEILCKLLSNLQADYHISENRNHKLVQENKLISDALALVTEEKLAMDEEFSCVLQEAAMLDCLSLIFKQSSGEKANDLASSIEELNFLHNMNGVLEQDVKVAAESLKLIEAENSKSYEDLISRLNRYNNQLVILNKDVCRAGDVNKVLNNQVEELKVQKEEISVLLAHKELETSEAYLQLQAMQNHNAEIEHKLLGMKNDLDMANREREQLEERVSSLTENLAKRTEVLKVVTEENGCLHAELLELQKVNEKLRTKKKKMASTLSKEIECCEAEFIELIDEFHLVSIRALLLEEKAVELMELLEGVEIRNLVEKNSLNEELASKNAQIDKLKNNIIVLEEEGNLLKTEKDKWHLIRSSLWKSISNLENYVHRTEKLHLLPDHEIQGNLARRLEDDYAIKLSMASEINKELQKLVSHIVMLVNDLVENGGGLVQTMFDLNSKSDFHMHETEHSRLGTRDGTKRHEIVESCQPNEDPWLPKGNGKKIHRRDELIMKDILLDHVTCISQDKASAASRETGTVNHVGSEDQMLELWETAEMDCNGRLLKVPVTSTVHDIQCRFSEPEEEEKSECTSEIVAEKELGVDKLEIPRTDTNSSSHYDWKSISEKLSSDSKRLIALRTRVEELKKKLQIFDKTNHSKDAELLNAKEQLKQVEDSITVLVDANDKLIKKIGDCSYATDPNAMHGDTGDVLNQRRQIAEQARRGNRKVGKMELELQKIQYVMLKLEEEIQSHRAVTVTKKTRVLLSDYLFGKGDGGRKRRHFCGCVRIKGECPV